VEYLLFAVLLMLDFVDVETPTLFRRTPGVSIMNTSMSYLPTLGDGNQLELQLGTNYYSTITTVLRPPGLCLGLPG